MSAGIALSLAMLGMASPAQATRPLTTGLMDSQYGSPDPATEAVLFDGTAAAGAELVKIGLSWRGVAVGVPKDPSHPADPAYEFGYVDRAVRDAAAHGLEPMLMVTAAPDYAEGSGRPADAEPGTWNPSPDAFAAFGRAVARRYSGGFVGLPRVRFYQAWNEPNLPNHLTPQYEAGQPTAGTIYRNLLNAFYAAVKEVSPDNVVVTAGTAPYGDPPGTGRTRPLPFWRDVLCLDRALRPIACPVRARFDVLAHNPINTGTAPPQPPIEPEDLTTGNFKLLRKLLRAAEHGGTISTPGPHPLWATEFWWETNPPDRLHGIPPRTQARWLAQTLYLLWRKGASVAIYLTVRDTPYHPDDPTEVGSSGIFFEDNRPKPAFTALRFPFVTVRAKAGGLLAWGRSPVAGPVRIRSRRAGHWTTVDRVRVGAGDTFKVRLPSGPAHRLRAEVAGERSLTWRR